MVGFADMFLSEASADLTIKFFSSFVAMFCAIAPVSIIGTRFAMSIVPFWTPEQFSERSVSPGNQWESYQVSSPRRWDAFWKLHFGDRGLHRLCAQRVRVSIRDHHD